MINPLLVGFGATIGAFLRNELTLQQAKLKIDFPIVTLFINIFGAILLGIFTAQIHNGAILLLLGTGFCGGFTTFGTFNMELSQLWFQHRLGRCFLYFVLTYIFGILGFIVGIHI
ncbi:integral membrane protein, CcrB [Companilactobacillus mindensis DSM 14500]|jgi:Integral membrane protein possibly involved in chromosome condensation|uniref:Fluoride-specific ion channel FluC n=1 Tax=Companilactobacillus mindensis DSM 14500 TaxID=1423770 RepID=A0A0R1QHN0_9LACO|nr:CrcB family protein [Companilactobacillus mindensis]KRL44375.1 integral membrane protein, CcrB [Companilactobacillus mindensis DSM 14500]GEO79808.1 putative fluoride ion transporter CrcB 1 [Companilactobacillus mindensis]